jgi:hypothetical protein
MDLYDFGQPILENTESDPFGGNQIQRQFSQCAGGVCNVENYRTGSSVLNSSYTDPRQIGGPGTANLGLGGTGGNFQNQRMAIKPGFGKGNGNFYTRPELRTFNRDFQRGSTQASGQYQYQQGLPNSYYPNTYSDTEYPYQGNYDPYPYTQQPNGQQNQGQQPQGPMRPLVVTNQSQNDQINYGGGGNQYGGNQQYSSESARQYNYSAQNNYYDDGGQLPPQQDPLSIIQKLSQDLPQQFQPELQLLQEQIQAQQYAAQQPAAIDLEVPGMPWVPVLLGLMILAFFYYSPELTKIYF